MQCQTSHWHPARRRTAKMALLPVVRSQAWPACQRQRREAGLTFTLHCYENFALGDPPKSSRAPIEIFTSLFTSKRPHSTVGMSGPRDTPVGSTFLPVAHVGRRMPSLNDSSYDLNRRIGGADDASTGGAPFRPRLGATIELFGHQVTLGAEHALGLLAAYVAAGLEGVLAIVALYLGFLFLRLSGPTVVPGPASTAPVQRPRRQRQPGLWGAIMHIFGPVPEGSAVTIGHLGEEADTSSAGQQVVGVTAVRSGPLTTPATTAKVSEPFDEAKVKATREAAARAAAARFEVLQRSKSES